jgi:transposase
MSCGAKAERRKAARKRSSSAAPAQGDALRGHRRVTSILGMLKKIEAERDAIALTEKVSAHTNAKKIQNLVKLKAIGAEIATVLTGEVFYRPFSNRRQVASYVGLMPSPFQGGSKCRDQGISKAGNPKARSTMIELAWLWLRHQPDSQLSIWFRERVGTRKGRIRRITIVAVAASC